MRVYLKQDHKEGCHAVEAVQEGWWDHPWYLTREFPPEPYDVIGRRHQHGMHNWFVFRCNSTDCKAWGIVSHAEIEVLIVEGLEEEDDG